MLTHKSNNKYYNLNINLCKFCIGLNERFARRNFRTHQNLKNFISFLGIIYIYFFKHSMSWIHGRLPEFFWIHFSQTFIALNVYFVRLYFNFGKFILVNLGIGTLNLVNLGTGTSNDFYFFLIRISIIDFFAFFYLIKWRLSDINKSRFNYLSEISIKKSE